MSKVKRVTQLLDDRVIASLYGRTASDPSSTASSSSTEDDQCSLADLVHGFLEEADSTDSAPQGDEDKPGDSSCENDDSDNPAATILSVLYPDPDTDQFRIRLRSDVLRAVEGLAGLRTDAPAFRSAVATMLREYGHNAGVCRTRWKSSGRVTAGSYEFVDVVGPGRREGRYIVDLEFGSEFEIARPTEEFRRVIGSLPAIFVGKAEELKQVLRLVSNAAKRSMKKRGLHLPPWRKNRYMQNKWLGSYSRTVTPVQPEPQELQRQTVQCRFVGFAAGPTAGNRRLVV